METNQERDAQLWKMAQKRASFKKHLATYFIMNAFFWALWFFGGGTQEDHHGWPWPIWPMLGWGIGIAFNYVSAYHDDKMSSTEKEYEKLKKEKEGR